MSAHILVLDDDTRLRSLLAKYLKDNGFKVSSAADAAVARGLTGLFSFDLLIVDIMLPEVDGVEFTSRFRKENQAPVMMLTALGDLSDRIKGLESGADDYLVKPFDPKELLLRINNILKRMVKEKEEPAVTAVKMGDCAYDLKRGLLSRNGERVHLSPTESMLLNIIAASPGKIFSREDLGRKTGNDGNLRTIDVQITRLRRKIEPDQKSPRYLQTVRGLGYSLMPD